MDPFGEVSHHWTHLKVKMCHMESVFHVLKFEFGWVWAPWDDAIEISIWGQSFGRGSYSQHFLQILKISFLNKSIYFWKIWNLRKFYFLKIHSQIISVWKLMFSFFRFFGKYVSKSFLFESLYAQKIICAATGVCTNRWMW